jgi:GAF domain-containing protein/HAMP domain-containing protein
MVLVASIVAAASFVAYVVLSIVFGAWQIFADAVGLIGALLCLLVARGTTRRGSLEAAGYWILAATLVAFIPGELFWANQTVYFVLSVLLLLGLAGNVIRPRRWWVWIATAAFYLAVILLINWQEAALPYERYPINQNPTMRYTVPGIVAALVLAILFQFVLAYRRLSTIRGRLLVSFVAVGVVPVVVIAATGTFFAWRSGRRNATDRLDLAASFVSAELDAWGESLRDGLQASMVEGEAIAYARRVLRSRMTGSDAADVYATLRASLVALLRDYVAKVDMFDALFLVDTKGEVALSSDEALWGMGQRYSGESFFARGLDGFALQPSFRTAGSEISTAIAAIPIADEEGRVIGVLAGQASKGALDEILNWQVGVGEGGEMYLVGENGLALTDLRIGLPNVAVTTEGTRAALSGESGTLVYRNYQGVPVVGSYRWLPELGAALLVEQSRATAFATMATMSVANTSIAVVAGLIAVVIALRMTQSIASPLADLVQTAGRIAGGELDLVADVERADEVGALAGAFNRMTAQLRELIGGLEQRVAERTRDLERRSLYLEAAAQVARTASAILDADRLFRVIVELIREQFDLYYVGLFQVGAGGQWAELRAGTGEAGRRMLTAGHRVQVGEPGSIVGWTLQHAEVRSGSVARVAQRGDATRAIEEDLPDARSEAALPLRSRGRILGALSVQSDQPDAFDQDLVVVLQTMADQVAVAMDNACLFEEGQAALAAARRASGDLSQAAWAEMLRARADLGFRSDDRGIVSAHDVWRPEMEQAMERDAPVTAKLRVGHVDDALSSTDHLAVPGGVPAGTGASVSARPEQSRGGEAGHVLAVPIRTQGEGEVIGVLDLRKPDGAGAWTAAQVELAELISEQLSLALENARLYEETQRRSVREQQLREIGTRMQSTVDLDAILRMAIEDLARALDVPSAFVQLYEGRPRTE